MIVISPDGKSVTEFIRMGKSKALEAGIDGEIGFSERVQIRLVGADVVGFKVNGRDLNYYEYQNRLFPISEDCPAIKFVGEQQMFEGAIDHTLLNDDKVR